MANFWEFDSSVEFIGLSSRACSHATPARRAPFAIQVVFIFLAPTFFVIALHMFLDRLIIASRHKDLSLIRLDRFLAIFSVGDCLSFIFQAFGVGQLVNARTQKGATLAGYVMLAGLAIQLLLVFLLIICLVAFQVRVSSPYLVTGVNPNLQLKSNLLLLGLCSFFILIRTTTRLVEFQGHFGAYFKDNEWVVYVLDINLMLLFMFFALPWYSAGNGSTRLMHNYPLMPRDRRL